VARSSKANTNGGAGGGASAANADVPERMAGSHSKRCANGIFTA